MTQCVVIILTQRVMRVKHQPAVQKSAGAIINYISRDKTSVARKLKFPQFIRSHFNDPVCLFLYNQKQRV